MKTLEITEQRALSAFSKGSESDRALLKNLFPSQDFNLSIMDRIKSYEDACAEIGIHPLTITDFSALPAQDQKATYAFHQITTIARALNEGWVPDWNNHSQYKYYPYFFYAAGGSGFSSCGYCYDCSYSRVGSRLVYKDRQTAEYAGKQFIDIYRDLMVIE